MIFKNILDFPFPAQVGLGLLAIWSLVWKGLALWKAGGRRDKWWFIAMLVLNTAGILEILYIFIFSEKKIDLGLKMKVEHDHSEVKENKKQ